MFDEKVFTLWILFAIFPQFSCPPFDVGICSPKVESCSCGGEGGYNTHIQIKQCSGFHRWKLICRDCDGQPSVQQQCELYAHCSECNPDWNRCVKCKPNRYGTWCTGICQNCENGGSCHEETGRCVCPHGFLGDRCEKIDGCTAPPSVGNGYSVNQLPTEIYPRGYGIIYQCYNGFVLRGNPTVFCQGDKVWTNELPSCDVICPNPASPANGYVSYDPLSKVAIYSCQPGYVLKGDVSRTCGVNSTWTGIEPQCDFVEKIVSCPLLESPNFGHVIIEGENNGEPLPSNVAKFSCDKDYALIGSEEVICGQDGTWSAPSAQCVLHGSENSCPKLGNFSNGKITVVGQRENAVFIPGTKVRFACDPLYNLVGKSSITCRVNLTWTRKMPRCVKISTCVKPVSFPNGHMEIFIPDPRTISQKTPKPLSSSVNVTSRKALAPRFRFRARSANSNSNLHLKLPRNHYHVGTRITFSCESPYYVLIGSKTRTCQSTGQWNGRQATCVPVCGRSGVPFIPKIVAGTKSEEGQWPWQVAISRRLDKGHPLGDWLLICGGSLLNEEWIVTAAHCVTYADVHYTVDLDDLVLYFGKYYRNDSRDDDNVQIRYVEEIQVHPQFHPKSLDSDIALIRISPKVKLTSHVQPVCLPDLDETNIQPGDNGTVIGWGYTKDTPTSMENNTFSSVLEYAQVPVVSNEQCDEGYKRVNITGYVPKDVICAGYEYNGPDSCSGDSGGPLVFPNHENQWVLEGLVSFGSPIACGNGRQYSGYTRIRHFMDWIEQFI